MGLAPSEKAHALLDDPFMLNVVNARASHHATLSETLKRHETKSNPRISADKMKEVYKYASPTGHEKEVIIPEGSSLEHTVEQIAQITGI